MKLTDANIRKIKVTGKLTVVKDELGLYLEVSPKGLKSWRLRLRSRVRGDVLLTLGHYPDMTLAGARAAQKAARERDYTVQDESAPAPTFRVVAKEWHETNKDRWKDSHAADVLASIEREVNPAIGDDEIAKIKAPTIKTILKRIEARGTLDVAHDIRQRIEAVFRYAEASGYRDGNPAASMREVLKAIPKATGRPAAVTLPDARAVLAAGEAAPAQPVVRLGLRFMALTVPRITEMRFAKWPEFEGLDSDKPTWRIPAKNMKGKKGKEREHVIPLSRQAVAVLTELRKLSVGNGYVFPATHDSTKSMSESAIGDLLDRVVAKGTHVPHGWRTSFSTIMNGRRKADQAVIDLMLAHIPKDKTEGAYNRQEHAALRREIAQEWADILLDGMPEAAMLTHLPRRTVRPAAQEPVK